MQMYIIVWEQHEVSKWCVNIAFKPGLTFKCFIIEISYKSQGMKIEKVLMYQIYALFAGDKRTGKI